MVGVEKMKKYTVSLDDEELTAILRWAKFRDLPCESENEIETFVYSFFRKGYLVVNEILRRNGCEEDAKDILGK